MDASAVIEEQWHLVVKIYPELLDETRSALAINLHAHLAKFSGSRVAPDTFTIQANPNHYNIFWKPIEKILGDCGCAYLIRDAKLATWHHPPDLQAIPRQVESKLEDLLNYARKHLRTLP